ADAEVEYHDHTSTTAWVRFPVVTPAIPALAGASVVIWTTTPWTLPGNRAIAYGPEIDYVLLRVTSAGEKSHARVGETLVLAKACRAVVEPVAGFTSEAVAELRPSDLSGTVARHPLHGQGYDFDVPLYPGAFVTDTDGTGFLHLAPGLGTT